MRTTTDHESLFTQVGEDEYECTRCGAIDTMLDESMPSMLGSGTDSVERCAACDTVEITNPLTGEVTIKARVDAEQERNDDDDDDGTLPASLCHCSTGHHRPSSERWWHCPIDDFDEADVDERSSDERVEEALCDLLGQLSVMDDDDKRGAGLDGLDLDVHSVDTFDGAGVMTTNRGLVVRLDDGSEYQLTIVQSQQATR